MNRLMIFILLGIIVSYKNNSNEGARQQQLTSYTVKLEMARQQVIDQAKKGARWQLQEPVTGRIISTN